MVSPSNVLIRLQDVRIAYSSGVTALRRFRCGTSGKCELDLRIDTSPAVASLLEGRQVVLAVMEWRDRRPGFDADPWIVEELVRIVPPDHPWAARDEIPVEWLGEASLLGGDPAGC
jgi:DNA-binding transcriptional LysR family regulator